VNHKPMSVPSPYHSSWKFNRELKSAWFAIIGFIVVVGGLLLAAPQFLIPIFPVASLGVGIFLYVRYPAMYIGFTWWMWFVGPTVRRIIDYRCGFITPGVSVLGPLLVTSISICTLLKYLPKIFFRGKDALVFALCSFSVIYGFFVGLIRNPIISYPREIIVLMSWLCPISFAFFLYINWRNYPKIRQTIEKTFLWGVLAMGIYGIFQFVTVPEWDKFYVLENDLTWLGKPLPFQIRVFSLMRDTQPFAYTMMAGLLLLLGKPSKFGYVVSALGYVVFLLSRLRTAWACWVISVISVILTFKRSRQIKLIISISIVFLFIFGLTQIGPFAEIINSRFSSLGTLESDNSLQSRTSNFERGINFALFEFIGVGLVGAEGIPVPAEAGGFIQTINPSDHGYLAILVCLGWFGAGLYLIGLLTELYRLFNCGKKIELDTFFVVARAIVLASIVRMITSNITFRDFALPFWGFLGIALAARKYHFHQNTLSSKLDLKGETGSV